VCLKSAKKVTRIILLFTNTGAQFHQRSKYSFTLIDPKVKNTVKSSVSFYSFGICGRKGRTLMKLRLGNAQNGFPFFTSF